MFEVAQVDESLLARLPLPLNQVFRRALNAKSPLEQHLSALYLFEVGLKLLASTAVVEYAALERQDPQLQDCLKNLARPSLGQWWEIGRRLVPVLAEAGCPGYDTVQKLLLGRSRDDMPRAAGLDAVLRERLEAGTGSRATVRLSELFDRLVTLRNKGPGHGAPAAHAEEFHNRMGTALLTGLAEVFGRLDVLAGRLPVYITEVRQSVGVWLVQWQELTGPSARRLPSLEFRREDVAKLPDGDRVYLRRPESDAPLRALYPLVKYDPVTEEVLLLNGRQGQDRADWLCYTTGRELREEADLRSQHQAMLASLLRMNVGPQQVRAWAEKSRADEPPVEPTPPQRLLGEFELISELGRGGMGVVYRAWQPSLGRQVALKSTFRAGDDKAEARFAREIRALGRVEHPHLVRIFTSGAEGDRWFYAMELVEGATLATVCDTLTSRNSNAATVDEDTWRQVVSSVCTQLRKAERPVSGGAAGSAKASPSDDAAGPQLPVESPMPPPPRPAISAGRVYVVQVVSLMRQAAQAVQALHAAGVIHRDIKPGNIMLTHSGAQIVLMDLGLAQLNDDVEGRLTRTRQFVGTLRYASPEQVMAAGRVDARSDIYSLGATLWELLTLRPLHGATEQMPTPELMQRIQFKDPESVRHHNPAVPRDLDAIVLKCLEKDPARRYDTAEELDADLARFLAGEPVLARPVGESERAWRWCRRNPLVAGLATAVALAVLLGLVGVVWKWREAEGARRLAVQNEGVADEQRTLAQRREREAEESRYAADMRLAQQAVDDGNLGRAVGLLRRYLPNQGEFDPRGFEWRYLCWACQGTSRATYHGHTDQVNCVTFSPDGSVLATASADKTVRLLDVASHQVQDTIQLPGPGVMSVEFSPSGKLLACATGNWRKSAEPGAVYLYRRDSKQIVDKLEGHAKAVNSVAISVDGSLLATASEDDTTMLWKIDESPRKMLGRLPGHSGGVNAAIFSPDSRYLAAGSGDGSLQIWKVDTRQVVTDAIAHVSGIMSLAFSRDSQTLLIGTRDGAVVYWDIAQGKATKKFDAKQGLVESIAFSRDGTWFATGGSNCTIALRKFTDPGEPVMFPGHRDMVYTLAFSPTEQLLASGSIDCTVKFWNWAEANKGAAISLDAAAAGVDFSRDGALLAVAEGGSPTRTEQHSGNVSLWSLDNLTPRDRTVLSGHHDQVTSVAFSPDGKLLVSGSKDHTAILWDVARKQSLATFAEHEAQVNLVRFSPDGSIVATASRDGTIKLWSASGNNSASLKTLRGHGGWVRSVAFSPDGRRLASASSDRTVRLWDVASGNTIVELPGFQGACNSVCFSPDGSLLAAGSNDRTTRIWPVVGGTIRPSDEVVLQGYNAAINAVAFSPDGKTLATGSQDSKTTLWNVNTREEVAVIAGHRGGVLCLAFDPSGQVLATGSNDQTVGFCRSVKSFDAKELSGDDSLWTVP